MGAIMTRDFTANAGAFIAAILFGASVVAGKKCEMWGQT
jgi:hypothetical protein